MPWYPPPAGFVPYMAASTGMPSLFELCVPEKGGAVTPAVCVYLLLFGKFYAAAVDEPDERAVKPLGNVRDPEDVVRLACDPGACHDLVVEADDDAPAAVYPSETVDHAGRSRLLFHGVVEDMEGGPGARIEDVLEPLVYGPFAPFGQDFLGEAGILLLLDKLCDLGLDLLDLLGIGRVFLHRLAELLHLFEIGSHSCPPGM